MFATTKSPACCALMGRFVWIGPRRAASGFPLEINKQKSEYYKNLGEVKDDETFPPGWETALPFESIPGPPELPIIGNFWRFLPVIGDYNGLDLYGIHKKMHEDFGKIATFGTVMGRKNIILYDPQDMETLFRNEGAFPIRNAMLSFNYYRTVVRKDFFGDRTGLVTMQGKKWYDFRTVVNPILMQPRSAMYYLSAMETIADELVGNMRHFAKSSDRSETPECFLNELYKWSLESIGFIALNKRLGCLNLDLDERSEQQLLIKSVNDMFNLSFRLDILPPLWEYFSTPTYRKFIKTMDYITFTFSKHVEEAVREIESRGEDEGSEDTLSALERLIKVDKSVAVAMALDMLNAGTDTTGKTLGAALYYLARNPDKQEKLRQETLKYLPSKTTRITKESLNDAQYLKAVVKETTRLAPIAVGLLRSTVKNMVLGGYQIPKGTETLTSNLYMCQSEKYFPKAGEFIPERFLRSTEGELSYKNAHKFLYMPFGHGPRSCIGKRLANLEMEVAIAKIVRNFELSWHHDDMEFETIFLHGIKNPLKLRLKEITK